MAEPRPQLHAVPDDEPMRDLHIRGGILGHLATRLALWLLRITAPH